MNNSIRYIAVRNYTEIFNETIPDDKLSFIRKYPTDLLMLRLSKINAILFQEPDIPQQTLRGLDVLFPGKDAEPLLEIRDFKTSAYFSSMSICLLIKACLENFVEKDGDDSPIHIFEAGLDTLKTILIFNETYFQRDPILKLDSFEGIFRLDMQQQAYIRDDVYRKIFMMVKFAFAAKYLSEVPDLREECLEFCEYYEVDNPWIFGEFFMSIFEATLPKEQVGKHILSLEGPAQKIISEFTIDRNGLRKHKSLSVNLDMVPKPFYQIGNNSLILDFDFFQYHIDQGFFYILYKCTSLMKSKRFNSYNAYQGYIGYHYFEQFLVKKYLSAIFFRPSQKIISSDQFQDFIIKPSNNRVLVVEVKNTAFHASTLEKMDFKSFLSTIEQNFLSSKEAESKLDEPKDKGLAQIFRQIGNLTSNSLNLKQLLDIKSNSHLKIYPVILYSDPNFDISGVNEYVNTHFEVAISEKRHLAQSIKPVTLVNVNTLISYFAYLKNKPSRLTDLITDYFEYIKKKKKNYKREGHLHDHYLSNVSFDRYLREHIAEDQWENNFAEMKKDFDLNIPVIK